MVGGGEGTNKLRPPECDCSEAINRHDTTLSPVLALKISGTMGAAASTGPAKIGVEGMKKLAGDKFDQATFDALKDDSGFVTKEQIIALEKEIAAQKAAAAAEEAAAAAANKPPPRTDFDPKKKYDKWDEVDYRDPDTGEWTPAMVKDNKSKDAIVPFYVIQFLDEDGDPCGRKLETTPECLRPSQSPEALAAAAAEREYVPREKSEDEKAAEAAALAAKVKSTVKVSDGNDGGDAGGADFRGARKEGCSCIDGNPCVDQYVCLNWENRFEVAKANA